jgi:Family of unknown function (DUF5947)
MASSALQRMARRAAQEREEALERCDLCGAPIAADHRHLLDVASRELMCACRPCALLFDRDAAGAGGRHYRLVPDRRLRVDDLDLDDVTWADLRLPVDMAFFFRSTPAERVLAFYPGPMGATESLLGLEAWAALEARNPLLRTLTPDVEALLVHRALGARRHYVVPISDCYELAGLIRTRWRGLTGGREVWQEIKRFYERLDRRARRTGQDDHEEEATWPSSGSARAM